MPIPRSSYYDQEYRQAASLARARRPYLIKNTITGIAIFSFAIGVYAYTIHAIAQDDFEDVPIPDAPPQSAKTPNVTASVMAANHTALSTEKKS